MHKRGFTLIELLFVISIIGLLASIILTSLSAARTKARDAQRVSELEQIGKLMVLNADPKLVLGGGGIQGSGNPYGTQLTSLTIPAGLSNFIDPSFTTTAGGSCKNASNGVFATKVCQYSVAGSNGTNNNIGSACGTVCPSTLDYEVCAYLEDGSAAYTGGSAAQHFVRVSSDTGGQVVAGCN